jgi:hypothetical protein
VLIFLRRRILFHFTARLLSVLHEQIENKRTIEKNLNICSQSNLSAGFYELLKTDQIQKLEIEVFKNINEFFYVSQKIIKLVELKIKQFVLNSLVKSSQINFV